MKNKSEESATAIMILETVKNRASKLEVQISYILQLRQMQCLADKMHE